MHSEASHLGSLLGYGHPGDGYPTTLPRTQDFLTDNGTELYDSLDALQADVDQWLHHYNYERPHLGYRNMGNRPFETINEYLSSVSQEA